MAKVDTIQTAFSGGEFAPALFGRTDIAQYANACAELENVLVKPSGPVISTPGTEYINACKTGGTTGISRIISFRFSRTDSYIIEIGVDYFRFYTDGSLVVSPGTTAYEVAHTYQASELFDIQYSQINDVVYMTHPDHAPQKLTRLGASEWTLTEWELFGGPFLPDNADTTITITPSATAGSISLIANSSIFTVSGSTVGHVGSYWKIAGATTDATTGLDVQGYVKITAIANPSTATATVKETLSAITATNEWAEGSFSSVRGYPARITFHQRRIALARTASQPQNVWLSQSFVYDNFAVNSGNADDALDLPLASVEGNDIKWLASAKVLIAGTYGGEFIIGSGTDGVITPANASVAKQTSWGSEPIVPKKIGNFFYYVQRFGQKLRELFYSWDLDNYKSVDKTILSSHIAGDGFIDLAYQMSPDTILWCVTTNGTIATLTREVDQEVSAWTRQTTDGTYESIATIPSRTEPHDEVWVIVNRTIESATVRYIERFKSPIVPDRQDKCFYVHSGLSYDAFALTTGETIVLSATSGTITVSSSTAYFSSGDVGQRVRAIDSDGAIVGEVLVTSYSTTTLVTGTVKSEFDALTYTDTKWGLSVNDISGMDHLEAEEVVVLVDGGTDKPNKTVSSGQITLANDGFVVAIGLPYSQKIKLLPQEAGSQRGTSQGKIQRINEAAFKLNRSHKGFKVGGSATALKTVSYIESVTPEVLYTGTIPNTSFILERISFRDPGTPMGTPEVLFTGTIPNVSVRDNYTIGSQLILQNDDPLPVELLSVITSIDSNDK